MDTNEAKKQKRTRVGAYPAEFKAKLVAKAGRPGASVAKVALAHGLNANMLHTWRREMRDTVAAAAAVPEFVALPVAAAPSPGTPIRIELRHGNTSVAVTWPIEAAGACAA
jgi:transposase